MTIFADTPDIPKGLEAKLPEMPKVPDNVPMPVTGTGMMGMKVVATTDGGIVIVTDNKVSKYDKNLKMVKTIELSSD